MKNAQTTPMETPAPVNFTDVVAPAKTPVKIANLRAYFENVSVKVQNKTQTTAKNHKYASIKTKRDSTSIALSNAGRIEQMQLHKYLQSLRRRMK